MTCFGFTFFFFFLIMMIVLWMYEVQARLWYDEQQPKHITLSLFLCFNYKILTKWKPLHINRNILYNRWYNIRILMYIMMVEAMAPVAFKRNRRRRLLDQHYFHVASVSFSFVLIHVHSVQYILSNLSMIYQHRWWRW